MPVTRTIYSGLDTNRNRHRSNDAMSDELIFPMGNYEVRVPCDRLYAKNHMWAMAAGEALRFGFSAYAVRLLQDVYFLDWHVDAGAALTEKQEIGEIESSKAESALYAPIEGTLTEFNAELLTDPSAINVDCYGPGWLFAITGSAAPLLTPQQYVDHLAEAWKVAERTIKGQIQ